MVETTRCCADRTLFRSPYADHARDFNGTFIKYPRRKQITTLDSFGHLSVITGYFSGIIHSIMVFRAITAHSSRSSRMFCSENSLRFSSFLSLGWHPHVCNSWVLLKSWVAFQFLRLSNLSRTITIPPPEPSVNPQSWGLGHCGYSSFHCQS